MQKKLIALALAALAPAAAMADDSNVTVYGLIDYGYAVRSGNENDKNQTGGRNGTLGEFAGGISAGNRIGFKGSEDLGNGLKAIFEIEFGFKGDDTAGTTFNKNRHSWVGLTGGFGTLLGGRVDGARYSFTGKYDPFKNQTVANAGSIFGATSNLGQADRADNAIVYITPELFPGFKVLGAYTKSLLSQEANGVGAAVAGQGVNRADTPLWAIAALYDQGPLSVTLDYENLKIINGGLTNSSGDTRFDIYVAGTSYDFGVAKVSAYYENTRQKEGLDDTALAPGATGKVRGDGWMLGVSAPFGPVTVMASYVQGRDKTDGRDEQDCRKFGVGAEYAFSKRTSLYTTAARISADDNATCAITYAASTSAKASAAPGTGAYGRTGFDLGIRHTF